MTSEPRNRSALDPATLAGIERVLKRLPGMERKVLDLRYGLTGGHPASRAEAAAKLGITGAEVDEIAGRGLQRLREVGDQKLMHKLLTKLTEGR